MSITLSDLFKSKTNNIKLSFVCKQYIYFFIFIIYFIYHIHINTSLFFYIIYYYFCSLIILTTTF